MKIFSLVDSRRSWIQKFQAALVSLHVADLVKSNQHCSWIITTVLYIWLCLSHLIYYEFIFCSYRYCSTIFVVLFYVPCDHFKLSRNDHPQCFKPLLFILSMQALSMSCGVLTIIIYIWWFGVFNITLSSFMLTCIFFIPYCFCTYSCFVSISLASIALLDLTLQCVPFSSMYSTVLCFQSHSNHIVCIFEIFYE